MKTSVLVVFISLALFTAHAQVSNDTDRLLVVVQNGLYGYIDHSGKVVIDPQFVWAADFDEGYGTVYVCGRYALIDRTGNVLSLQTPRASKQLNPKKIGEKFGFSTADGKLKIQPQFDAALRFSEGLAAVRVGKRWGFIYASGKFAIPPRFDGAYYFRDGVGIAKLGDTTVIIDKAGKELAHGYDVLSGVASEGLIPVSRDDKYGYLDLTGKVAIPLIFDGASTFSEGLAAVQKESKWGYIDKNGALVIPFKFDSAGEFGQNLAPVSLSEESGFINHTGSFAFRLAFASATGFWGADRSSDVSRFWTKSGQFGYVDTSGRVIWGPADGSPDHPPLFGWSAEDKKESCDSVSETVRKMANALPTSED